MLVRIERIDIWSSEEAALAALKTIRLGRLPASVQARLNHKRPIGHDQRRDDWFEMHWPTAVEVGGCHEVDRGATPKATLNRSHQITTLLYLVVSVPGGIV